MMALLSPGWYFAYGSIPAPTIINARLRMRSQPQFQQTTKSVWVAESDEEEDYVWLQELLSSEGIYLFGCASGRSRGRMEGKRKQNSSRAGWKSSIYSTLTAHSPQLFKSRPARFLPSSSTLGRCNIVFGQLHVRGSERFFNFSTCDFAHQIAKKQVVFVQIFHFANDARRVGFLVKFFPPFRNWLH